VLNSTHQLAHPRSSINQCYNGERIHQLFPLCVYFYIVQTDGVRSEMQKNSSQGNVGMWIRTERPVITFYLPNIHHHEPCSTCASPAHKIVFQELHSSSSYSFYLQSVTANMRNRMWAYVGSTCRYFASCRDTAAWRAC